MIGSRLGSYEITAAIGAGGMGEVWRATDAKLGREVAVKVLPAAFTEDAERLARFEREARLLASLNHPNVAHVYGFESAQLPDRPPVHFLAMELVEGEDLAERLKRGPIPLDEALEIARQIAEALEEAHEKGIVHRDLKPANVKVTPDGKVKVLDFGLAKAWAGEPGSGAAAGISGDLSQSPTCAHTGTQLGVILGTAGYMSPEQARGKPVDKRADIWAFGVVLHEMLSGRRLFEGETVSDVLAGVLKTEVDLRVLPHATPPAVRTLLRRCLERNPRNRLHDVGDARVVLDEVLSGRLDREPESPASPQKPNRTLWRTVLPWVLVAGLGALALVRIRQTPAASVPGPKRALELSIPLGNLLTDDAELAFAPDGGAIVFAALDPATGPRLWLRRLDRFDAQPLRGTEGASFPFWSPDARSVGFFRGGDATLCRYDLATGAVEVLTRCEGTGRGAAWGADGTILFAPSSNSPLQRLDLASGTVRSVTVLDPKVLDGSHRFPVLLPDGKRFLFTFWSNQLETASRIGGIYLGSFEKGIERRLTPDLSQAVLVGHDRLVVRRGGALVALRFDPGTLTITGGGERIDDRPRFSASSGALAASGTAAGDLAYALATGETGGQLVWLDRQGKKAGTVGSERLSAQRLVLAPDGRRFAAQAISASGQNIWVGDDRRQVISRLTPDALDAMNPVWSPDGRRIAYSTEAEGSQSIYVQEADGSRPAELLLSQPDRDFVATGWSADGRLLLLQANRRQEARTALWLYDFETHAARELLLDASASLGEPALSEDGRWLAYTSDESGNPEVFVRTFPALDRKWKISQGGALAPHWRRDGRELLFVDLTAKAVLAVDVAPGREGLEVGIPHRLFVPGSQLLGLAPDADHGRFLAGIIPGDVRTEPVRVLLGWRRGAGSEEKP